MAIPNIEALLIPLLQILENGETHHIRQLTIQLADRFELSDEELKELMPGGIQAKFHRHVLESKNHLERAALVQQLANGEVQITEEGISFLTEAPETLALTDLPNSKLILADEDKPETAVVEDDPIPTQQTATESNPAYVTESQLLQILSHLPQSQQNKATENQPPTESTTVQSPDPFVKQPVNLTLMALLRIVETYFQHPWLYWSPILILGIACAVYFYLETPPYISEGIISVQSDTLIENVAGIDTGGFSWVTPAQATSEEFAELLQTDAFIRLIIHQTPLEENMDDGEEAIEETLEDARDAITVLALGASQLKLTAEFDDAVTAHKLAEGAVSTFIQWKIDADKQDSISARIFLENIIPEYEESYNSSIDALEGYLLQHPEPLRGNRPALEELQIERLQTEVSQSYTRYIEAQESLEQIRLQEVIAEGTTRQTYTIVDHPVEPRTPEIYLQDVIIVIIIFTVVGIALSVGAILGNSVIDRTMRLPIDARFVTDLNVLAVIPAPERVSRRQQRRNRRKNKAVPTEPEAEEAQLAPASD